MTGYVQLSGDRPLTPGQIREFQAALNERVGHGKMIVLPPGATVSRLHARTCSYCKTTKADTGNCKNCGAPQ